MHTPLTSFRWFLLSGMLALLPAVAGYAVEVTVTPVEGARVKGALEAASAEQGLTVAGKAWKVEDIAEIDFATKDGKKPAETVTLWLRNGDRLFVKIASGDDENLKVTSEILGELTLKYAAVRGLQFPLPKPPAASVLENFFAGADKDQDQVLTPRGENIEGFMETFSDKEVGFEAGGQKRKLPFTDLAAFRFASLETQQPLKGVQATLHLADGSQLTGRPVGLAEDKLKLECAGAVSFDIPVVQIRSLGVKGGRLVYLSDLKPSAAEEKPLIGGTPMVMSWRADTAVSGEPMRIAKRAYSRGIGTHAYCKLTYELGGAYKKFLVDVGLDASASSGGQSAWKVLADGKELKSGEAKAGGEATPLVLDLNGAQKLELVTDFGPDHDDAGDHLNWGNARLVK